MYCDRMTRPTIEPCEVAVPILYSSGTHIQLPFHRIRGRQVTDCVFIECQNRSVDSPGCNAEYLALKAASDELS